MDVLEAMTNRKSVRAFTDRPVSRETVEAVLDAARWAPSGVNTQPWKVVAVRGAVKQRIAEEIVATKQARVDENPDYQYYPQQWVEPYKSRRRECGLALYGALGIARDDIDARKQAWYRNYHFFGAPVGLLFFLDRRMQQGSWMDTGMFLQNVMLAAMAHELGTCPQASLAEHPDIVRNIVDVDPGYALVCGMAIGYPDESAPVNGYRTTREPVGSFTTWHE